MKEQKTTESKLRLILLDRDGVINSDTPDFVKSPIEWHALPGAIEAVVTLQERFTVAVCTNQSGIGRALFDESTLAAIHTKLNTCIKDSGGDAVDIFYCPHHPDAGCRCRKPHPELLQRAMRSHGADPQATLYVGDSEKDLLAALQAGCKSALVLTGKGSTTLQSQAGQRATMVCDDLASLPAALAEL
jgi:D-glycero-D-manno-heptose 1,7-bisphosphate phosphatase